jgi:hypothetical protein
MYKNLLMIQSNLIKQNPAIFPGYGTIPSKGKLKPRSRGKLEYFPYRQAQICSTQ